MTNDALYPELLDVIVADTKALLDDVEKYREGGMSNASLAQRIRKQTNELTQTFKDFRKDSVAYHKK